MKKIYSLVLAIAMSGMVFAQKFVPQIGIGTVLNYNIIATNANQTLPLTLTVISLNDPMKFKWDIPGFGMGSFLIPVKSLESGTKMRLEEPSTDEATKYKDDETIMFISKASLNDMIKNQSFTMNKTKFIVKPLTTPYQINGKDADVLYAKAEKGGMEIWILNNPNFPLICKLTGSPAGIDFDLGNVKE